LLRQVIKHLTKAIIITIVIVIDDMAPFSLMINSVLICYCISQLIIVKASASYILYFFNQANQRLATATIITIVGAIELAPVGFITNSGLLC